MSGCAGLARSGQSTRIRRPDTVPGLESDLSADRRHYSELELHPILAAAVEEFRQHGYHGSTVRDRRTGSPTTSSPWHCISQTVITWPFSISSHAALQTTTASGVRRSGTSCA
ncbi:hypothetical protein FDG2_3428 [Candidatus Protofrankia californiensis]|uniref:Uncharacterized protein n=1 Tax=Candidatus Protofrankia californiensis TaxID=1839754 RepID=A0A1C3NZT0_9ACTN|nr:hypothetical protein FDG2_3428 [Candidatus Protofrankia californiensis]